MENNFNHSKFENVVIESMTYVLPDTILTSEELELRLAPLYERLNLPYGRLELMTGIKQLRYWPTGTSPSQLSLMAAEKLLKGRDEIRSKIGMLIHASVCRDYLEPATASRVHQQLGLSPSCHFFDLSNACLGVLSSWWMAFHLIENGALDYALVVSGENSGPLLEETVRTLLTDSTITRKSIKKYISNLTIGSGAYACLLTHKRLCKKGLKPLAGVMLADTVSGDLCHGGGTPDALMMETNSEELLKKGVDLAAQTWSRLADLLKWDEDTADQYISHQVGQAHQNLLFKTLGLDKTKDFNTFHYLGNCGSAALPITLAIALEQTTLPDNGKLALLGIGSGLSSIMYGVEKWSGENEN